jgi:hypothetical protein
VPTPYVVTLAMLDANAFARAYADIPMSEQVAPHGPGLDLLLQRAEDWANQFCETPLGPRTIELGTILVSCDGDGTIRLLEPMLRPIISVPTLTYEYRGSDPVLIDGPRFQVDGGQLVFPHAVDPQHRGWKKSKLAVNLTYTTGWSTTALVDAVAEGDHILMVDNTAWLVPGWSYHLWAPTGEKQAVTISPSWARPAPVGTRVSGAVPITGALRRPCQAGTVVTDLPTAAHDGVVSYALALMRAEAEAHMLEDDDPYPDTALNACTRHIDPREVAPVLVSQAQRLLTPYKHDVEGILRLSKLTPD